MRFSNIKKDHYALVVTTIIVGVFYGPITIYGIELIPSEFTFDFSKIITLGIGPCFTYLGMMSLNRTFLEQIQRITDKKCIHQGLIIITTFFAVMMAIFLTTIFGSEINPSNFGILYELMGFFIFLIPKNQFLIKFIQIDSKQYDLAIRTTAIVLISLGLLLQISHPF